VNKNFKSLNKLIEKLCRNLPQKLLQRALLSVIVIYSHRREQCDCSDCTWWVGKQTDRNVRTSDFGLRTNGRPSCCIVEVGAKWSCGPFNQSLVLPIFIYQVSAIKDLKKKRPQFGPPLRDPFARDIIRGPPVGRWNVRGDVMVARFRHISHFVAKSIKPEMHVDHGLSEWVGGKVVGTQHPLNTKIQLNKRTKCQGSKRKELLPRCTWNKCETQ